MRNTYNNPLWMEMNLESEVSRRSSEYVRWIQSSLNRLIGTNLAVDGDIGNFTRAAIRSFQSRAGGLDVDGDVGPMTEAAMIRAGAPLPPGYGGSASPTPSVPVTPSVPSAGLRANMQRIAYQEWTKWRQGAIKESDPNMQGILMGYWNAVPTSAAFKSTPNWWFEHSWSSAFISSVVKAAGAGNLFSYNAIHTTYAFAAKQNRIAGNTNPFKLWRTSERKPQIGDIVLRNYQSNVNFDTLQPGMIGSHGDIVVNIVSGHLEVIGGNVGNSVTMRKDIQINANGMITSPFIWAIVGVDDVGIPSASPIDARPAATPIGGSPAPAPASGACSNAVQLPSNVSTAVHTVRNRPGYAGYGGGRVDAVLSALVRCGKINLSVDEIDTFQRISNVESSGQIQGLNSWDSDYMSLGFMQLTWKSGKLQRWIDAAPASFKKYGIELAAGQHTVRDSTFRMISGVSQPSDVRSKAWAERFYLAGLDVDIIAAEVTVCKQLMQELLNRLNTLLGQSAGYFNAFYSRSPYLRGLVHATSNNRPAYLRSALTNAVGKAQSQNVSDVNAFIQILSAEIRERYRANAAREGDTEAHMIGKANNLISKTANP